MIAKRATAAAVSVLVIAILGFAGLRAYEARERPSGIPDYYPAAYGAIVRAARAEGELVIDGVVDSETNAMSELLAAFHQQYPFVKLVVADKDGTQSYAEIRNGTKDGGHSADFVWSRAMHLQEKLINDGYSLPYPTPEMPFLSRSAHWRDLGYSSTLEPLVMVFNRRFLPGRDLPHTHAQLSALLAAQPDRFHGKVAIYNPEFSEVGMLLLSQDVRITHDTWRLYDTFGASGARTYRTSRAMLQGVADGRQWIAYNVVASYAVEAQRLHPELQIVYPTDYILDLSRVGFIAANAAHPNAAKLFLDFVLSKTGQAIFRHEGMGPVRTDMQPTPGRDNAYLARTQIIRIGPGLLAPLDKLVRAELSRRWMGGLAHAD